MDISWSVAILFLMTFHSAVHCRPSGAELEIDTPSYRETDNLDNIINRRELLTGLDTENKDTVSDDVDVYQEKTRPRFSSADFNLPQVTQNDVIDMENMRNDIRDYTSAELIKSPMLPLTNELLGHRVHEVPHDLKSNNKMEQDYLIKMLSSNPEPVIQYLDQLELKYRSAGQPQKRDVSARDLGSYLGWKPYSSNSASWNPYSNRNIWWRKRDAAWYSRDRLNMRKKYQPSSVLQKFRDNQASNGRGRFNNRWG